MKKYESMLESNSVPEELSEFLNKNSDSLVCDGCGKSIDHFFCVIQKNSDNNPLNRTAIVHLKNASVRCRIRQCSGCKVIVNDQELSRCPKCDTTLPRNLVEVF